MNIRIDSHADTMVDRTAPQAPAQASPAPASPAAAESAQSAQWAVRNENLAASRNPLQDAAAAAKAALLVRNQIASNPAVALAAHQLSLRSVSSLLS
ncbi:MAG: hypothetical protein KGR26_03055 [Cyanobacteria bacterium REEB65]|nr:hypothetical protein [Cyanobacteria bacterium REEB65]